MTSDTIDEANDTWYDSHLDEWTSAGWDTKEISEYLEINRGSATEALMHVEFLIGACERLITRMSYDWLERLDISNGLFIEWVEALSNPFNYDQINARYTEWAKHYRRWELALANAQGDWEAVMRSEERLLILARCDALDESSKTQLNLLIPLMSDPSSYAELDNKLSEIEETEARQKRAVYSSLEALMEEGYTVDYIAEMNLIDAMQEIGKKQKMHNLHEIIRLQIIDDIAEFDDDLAERFENQRKAMRDHDDENKLIELSEQISAMGLDLKKRLSALNLQIVDWEERGISLSTSKISPKDMFEWETNLPELTTEIDNHLKLVERYEFFSNRLQDITPAHEHLGFIDQTIALSEIVDGLELRWKDAELECYSIIEKYHNLGLELDGWASVIAAEPLTSLQQIKSNEGLWQDRLTCIDELLKIDVSFDGLEAIEKRINLLREVDVGSDVIEDTQLMITRMVTRRARHRMLLEKELIDLIAMGKASEDTLSNNMNLKEFETFVSEARKYGAENVSLMRDRSKISNKISQRINDKISAEIDLFESAGWYVEEMRQIFTQDPIHIAKLLPTIRSNITNHDALRTRLINMPWKRNIELALTLQEEIQNPLKLAQINQQIPSMIKDLAKMPIQDEGFTFTAWEPNPQIITTLAARKSKSEPVDAYDDAHDAILESMEVDEENFSQADESSSKESIIESVEPEKSSESVANEIPNDEVPVQEQHVDQVEDEGVDEPIQLKVRNPVDGEGANTEHLHVMMEKLGLSDNYERISDETKQIQNIRRSLAKKVGVEPRDVRVDRMLRLILRLLPQSNEHDTQREKLIMDLVSGLKRYQNWVKIRLEARHKASKNSLILDSETLGKALERIPGPGFKVPLHKDDKELPAPGDIDELTDEVRILLDVLNLPSASGIVVSA